MRQKKFWFTMSGNLAVLAVVLMLPAGAGAASKYKVLHKFKYTDGAHPYGRMVFDTAGNLYGTTSEGGASGGGTVFKLTPNSDGSWTERALYRFCSLKNCIDGVVPFAGLIFDAAGNLYGTTEAGGGGSVSCPGIGCGTAFKLTPNSDGTWRERVMHGFKGGADGKVPYAGLIFDAVGNLYGTTLRTGGCCGSGMVFQLTPNSDGTWTENVLYRFRGGADGRYPRADLIFDAAGSLYGTTEDGGGKCNGEACGTVFKLTPNSDGTWMESVLYRFRGGADGRNPSARLIFDAAGNLYGTTVAGGRGGSGCCGVVFKLTPNSDGTWTESVLHRFTGGSDGAYTSAELIFDAAGNLYGTTGAGGAYGYGVVFELMLTSTGWRERVLHAFAGNPAYSPYAGVVLDKAGNLYGTTNECGSGETCRGVVFEITP